MAGEAKREARKDPWAAAYATEASLEAAEALLNRILATVRQERQANWQRGRATTWAVAGSAEHVLELAKALSDFVHREGEYAPENASAESSAPPRRVRRARQEGGS